MSITKDKTVAEVVSENTGAAHVFSNYNIDFCCGGYVTLETVCKERGIEFNSLKTEIEKITATINNDTNYSKMDIISLIDFTKREHHVYIKDSIKQISQLAVKVAEVHWVQHKEVIAVNNLFSKAVSEIIEQLSIEKNIIFPFIEKLVAQENSDEEFKTKLEVFKKAVQNIETSYKNTGDIFKSISKLTSNYSPPTGACNTFKLLYEKLHEFEQELHKFIHFEKNILFSRVLENKLK